MSRLTIPRAILLALVLQWLAHWLLWTFAAPPRGLEWVLTSGQAVLFASLGALAVRRGRRWSAPLVAVAAALGAGCVLAIVGLLTGQYYARGIGPAYVLAYTFAALLLALVAGTIGAVFAAYRQRTAGVLAG